MKYLQYLNYKIHCIDVDGKTYYRALDVTRMLDWKNNPLARQRYVNQWGIKPTQMILVEETTERLTVTKVRYIEFRVIAVLAAASSSPKSNAFRDWVFDMMDGQREMLQFSPSDIPMTERPQNTKQSFWGRLFNA